MNIDYFIVWVLDEILDLPQDIIRWEIWAYIDYHSILRRNVGRDWRNYPFPTLIWICKNQEFDIGEWWAYRNVRSISYNFRIDIVCETFNKIVVNWVFNFLAPLLTKSDITWIQKSLKYISYLVLECCQKGDIDTVKKIIPKYITNYAEVCTFDDDPHLCPIYESWYNDHKDLTEYLNDNLVENNGFIYDVENDNLTLQLYR